MVAAGREPAPEGGEAWGALCPPFGFSLRWEAPGLAEVRLWHESRRRRRAPQLAWGQPWPDRGEMVPGSSLLERLAGAWPAIALGYAPQAAAGGASAVVDLAGPGLPRMELEVRGADIEVRSRCGASSPGSESVIVVETLMALGDVLAAGLDRAGPSPEPAAWRAVRGLADLLPAALDIRPEADGDAWQARRAAEEAAYYARRLGVDQATYALEATWLDARRLMALRGSGEEPGFDEYDPARRCEGLPPADEVARLAAAACLPGSTPEDLALEALASRNLHARQVVLFAPRPGPGKSGGTGLAAGSEAPQDRS
jgi:hypothetical protein